MAKSSRILPFSAEFIQFYACQAGRGVAPDEHAIRVKRKEIKLCDGTLSTRPGSAFEFGPVGPE